MGTSISLSITIILKVFHVLEYLLVAGNVCLAVVGLEFPLVHKGAELLFKLPSMTLGETWTKKSILEFLEHGTDIVGLAELVDTGLCGVSSNIILSLAKHRAKSRTYLGNLRYDMSLSNLALTPL